MKLKAVAILLPFVVGVACAVTIYPGVVLKPSASNWSLIWNFTYLSNDSINITSTYVQIGNITINASSPNQLEIYVEGWYPNNVSAIGNTVFDFTINGSGSFTVNISGLPKNMGYTIYKNDAKWRVVGSGSSGAISFEDTLSKNSYTIVAGMFNSKPNGKHYIIISSRYIEVNGLRTNLSEIGKVVVTDTGILLGDTILHNTLVNLSVGIPDAVAEVCNISKVEDVVEYLLEPQHNETWVKEVVYSEELCEKKRKKIIEMLGW